MQIQESHGIYNRIEELIDNLAELETAVHQKKKSADLCEVEFVTPLSILPLATFACQNGISITCSEENYNVLSYLETIGFPNGFTDFTKTGKRYLPITRLPPIEDNTVLGEYEDRILFQASKEEWNNSFKQSLKHLTSELVNNVNEHAKIGHYWLFAQYWENKNTCEIVLADCGIGYRKSYAGTEFEVNNDFDAIVNALEGKSSKKYPQERGYGIPTIRNMFVNGYGGKLVIISGDSGIYYRQDKRKEFKLKSYWQGSLVGINFNIKTINPYDYL